MPYRKILCAVDFSEPSLVAMAAAIELAMASGGSLTLLHVFHVPVVPAEFPIDRRWVDAVVGDIDQRLAGLKGDVEKRGLGRVDVARLEGTAVWESVVNYVKDGGYDLTVVGTHGHTGLRHVFLGSVAEKIVRHAPGPVLVGRSHG